MSVQESSTGNLFTAVDVHPVTAGEKLISFQAESLRDTPIGRVAEQLPNPDVTSWLNVLDYFNASVIVGFQSLGAGVTQGT